MGALEPAVVHRMHQRDGVVSNAQQPHTGYESREEFFPEHDVKQTDFDRPRADEAELREARHGA